MSSHAACHDLSHSIYLSISIYLSLFRLWACLCSTVKSLGFASGLSIELHYLLVKISKLLVIFLLTDS